MDEPKYIPAVESAIRLYMKANALSAADLAERLNITQSGVNLTLKRGFGKNAKKWADTFGFNVAFLTTGEGQLMNATEQRQNYDEREIPLLPIFAQAGHLVDFSDAIRDYDCERIIPPVSGAEFAVTVYGSSMEPEFPSGAICLCKRINARAFIEWGKTYILDTCNGTLLKYLAPGSEGKIKCISANPDPMYAPFEVSMEDVLGVYRVLMCMAMK